MAINYASKYSNTVSERIVAGALSTGATVNSVDFTGVNAVNIYSVGTAAMNDYKMVGTDRYGSAAELENTVETMVMTQDKSFTFTIDKRNYTDTQMVMEAGKALARQTDEVIIPMTDTYVFNKIVEGAMTENITTGAVTKANAYELFLDSNSKLDDLEVPTAGRVAYVSANYHKTIKLDPQFVRAGDLSQQMLLKGQVGEIDGVPVVKLPKTRMPAGVEFFITIPEATTKSVKLEDYKIHQDPPGLSGWLVEGRIYFDAWVFKNRKKCIAVHKSTATMSKGSK